MTQVSTPAPTSGISTDTSRLKSAANLKVAGEKFEAVFTGMMLKSMRAAKLADPLFDSKALDTFRDMQDGLLTKSMAEHTPLGIGKAMTEFLSRTQTDLQPATKAVDSATAASQSDLNPNQTSPPQ